MSKTRGLLSSVFRQASLATVLMLAACPRAANAMESRSFALSWFSHAAASEDGDCKGGLNPKMDVQYGRDLLALGLPPEKVEALMKGYGGDDDGGGRAGWDKNELLQTLVSRAQVNGKPASAYANPAAVVDPKLNFVTGKHAFGFDLDGEGASDTDSFEDPDTKQKGVDNQLFRVLGCLEPYRGTKEHPGTYWTFMWTTMKDTMPTWVITISGADLAKDGPVTILLRRAMEPVRYNGDGEARTDLTYRIDPDPRLQKNTYHGEIKNGVVSITEPGPFFLLQDPLMFPAVSLSSFHLRMSLDNKGYAEGLIGGYQPIEQIYFGLGNAGVTYEQTFSPELPGIYHLMRRFADADPDAKGQNWSISTAYYFKAARAFVVEPDLGNKR